jgi:cytochrome c oxidase subunit IV
MSFSGLLSTYIALLVLLALEFAASSHLGPSLRLLILVPALLMVGIVAILFMELNREGAVTLLFATSGVFWLAILLGLGLADPLTRATYPTSEGALSSAMKGVHFR